MFLFYFIIKNSYHSKRGTFIVIELQYKNLFSFCKFERVNFKIKKSVYKYALYIRNKSEVINIQEPTVKPGNF